MNLLLFLLMIVNAISQTVPSLNLSAYYGRWIQVYDDYAVRASFEHDIVCDSAYYTPYPNGTIAVINTGNINNVSGPLDVIQGWAQQTSNYTPGELTVHLQPTGGFGAPYWIYQLGPIISDQYQYSIVSDDIKLTLFVLARNYTDFFQTYNFEVATWLFKNGFDGTFNTPLPTNQMNCTYLS